MIRNAHRLEILAGKLESRYGTEDQLAREVRASIPRAYERAHSVRTQLPLAPTTASTEKAGESKSLLANKPL